jgi:hypothetical protein
MRTNSVIIALFCIITCYGQVQKNEVLLLGSFHFGFQNLDVIKIEKGEQIDVLEEKYQKEIKDIVNRLAAFKPTIIVIERHPRSQKKTDSLFKAYISGSHQLKRSESEQIGFRLAKKLGLDKLYCADDWGLNYPKADAMMQDSTARSNFMEYFYNSPDSSYFYDRQHIFKDRGIRAELIESNKQENLRKSLGNYLIGPFKYELQEDEFIGVDFTTGWWFNRNLRIFRNIQRIDTQPEDRILVIFGSGHMNLLHLFFDASPEYELRSVLPYLE